MQNESKLPTWTVKINFTILNNRDDYKFIVFLLLIIWKILLKYFAIIYKQF